MQAPPATLTTRATLASLTDRLSPCESPSKPSFRKGWSGLDINDSEFEWLKGYLLREHSRHSNSMRVEDPSQTPTPELSPDKSGANRKSKAPHDIPTEEATPKLMWSASLVLDQSDDELVPSDGFAKTKRRKIGWTNTEDLAILAAVRRIGTQWPRIAAHLPGRTADAVRNRWHRLQKMHTLGDSEEGRSAIDSLLIASGVDPDWVPPEIEPPIVATASTNSKDDTYIRGSDHGRSMWTAEEDAIIESGVAKFGCKWRQIAALLSNRSDSSVRNRWMRLCKERQIGRDATSMPALPPLPPAQPQPVHEDQVQVPKPMLVKSRSSLIKTTDDLDCALASAVHALDVDEMPLGMEAPELLVDLDSFVEAVAGVLRTDGVTRDDLLQFEVDSNGATRLACAPPRAQEHPTVSSGDVLPKVSYVAAGVLAAAGLAIGAAVVSRRVR